LVLGDRQKPFPGSCRTTQWDSASTILRSLPFHRIKPEEIHCILLFRMFRRTTDDQQLMMRFHIFNLNAVSQIFF
jgi:hypothetical protein